MTMTRCEAGIHSGYDTKFNKTCPECHPMTPPDKAGVRHRKGLVHVIADCKVCGKHWENYLTAQKLAAAHARKTGHEVIADLGYTVTYSGRRNP